MRYKNLSVLIAIILTIILLLGFHQTLQAQGAIDTIIVTDIDVSEFPQVNLRMRPLDRLGIPVANLSSDAILVYENDGEVALESLTEVEEGVWVHFVIDAGTTLNSDRWERTREGILSFVQTTPWMKENLDHVAVTVVEAGGAQLLSDYVTDKDTLVRVLEGYSPPGGTNLSRPLAAIDDIVEEMDVLDSAQGQAKFVVLFTALLEAENARTGALAQKASELGIPIYTVSVNESVALGPPPPTPVVGPGTPVPSPPKNDQPLADLGVQSGGTFTHYQNSNSMNSAYQAIVEYRRQYDLSYRSKLSLSGTRQVRLNAAVGEGAVSTITSYTVEVNPPRVVIEQPGSGELILREAPEYTVNLGSIPPTNKTVIATVIFPDEHSRRLQSAILLVNGETAGPPIQFPGTRIEIPWSLRDIQELGVSEFTLQVLVTDELGLDAESPPVTARVEVKVPPRPTVTAPPTIIVAPTPSIECITPGPVCDYLEKPIRSNPISSVSLGVAGLSLIMVAVVWVNRDKAPVQAMRNTVSGVIDQMTKRLKKGTDARAYLVVLDGDSNIGKALEIYGNTPVGRSRQNAELLFQQTDPNSPISRLHCTIIDDEDHFMIRDEDSANGTFLNGHKLKALEPEELHDGDEIELARVERGGVRVLFQVAAQSGHDGLSEDVRQTRATRSASPKPQKVEQLPEEDRF